MEDVITVFVCEDSLDGILTGVYTAWDSRLGHARVRLETAAEENLELFCEYRQVETELEKAEKVLRTVRRRMGEEAEDAICYAAACEDGRKADAIYRMIVLGLHLIDGRETVHCLQDTNVSLIMKLRTKAWHEAHRLMGFVRFEELEDGILYARIAPVCAVLPLLAPHFADRYRQENWVLHDVKRRQLALHRADGPWVLAEDTELDPSYLERRSSEEAEFCDLWKSFCESVAIQERRNPRCQQGFLPLRFRPFMTEFQQTENFF